MSQIRRERPLAPNARLLFGMLVFATALTVAAAPPDLLPPPDGDIPAHFNQPTAADDYLEREAMIPMRDGVRLYTVIVIPKNAHDAPIVLTRTPYNATERVRRAWSTRMLATLSEGDEELAAAGYI